MSNFILENHPRARPIMEKRSQCYKEYCSALGKKSIHKLVKTFLVFFFFYVSPLQERPRTVSIQTSRCCSLIIVQLYTFYRTSRTSGHLPESAPLRVAYLHSRCFRVRNIRRENSENSFQKILCSSPGLEPPASGLVDWRTTTWATWATHTYINSSYSENILCTHILRFLALKFIYSYQHTGELLYMLLNFFLIF